MSCRVRREGLRFERALATGGRGAASRIGNTPKTCGKKHSVLQVATATNAAQTINSAPAVSALTCPVLQLRLQRIQTHSSAAAS
jgi:hypothetical protein